MNSDAIKIWLKRKWSSRATVRYLLAILARLDTEGCRQLLAFLASQATAVPYEELRAAGWEDHIGQLRNVEGIVFLEKGLNLTTELRQELASLSPV